ncbi:hypothetical protein LL999_16085 [Burkholderia ambifaria]|uniref:hypothetical protein n=1 Tax=Burkholderia ambifaria TaxID=152480 RepID=UPI001E4561A6|nr:hypothetical protein [Burkholderia ambifaria]UEP24178.1 hypothetical protein LL999_16085 [Burkholderia ambifaria]
MEERQGLRCGALVPRGERVRYGSGREETASDTEPSNIFSLMIRIYRTSPALLALHLSGAVIASFAPDDALARWPLLNLSSLYILVVEFVEM